jgi:hypothetical protein
MHVAVGPPSAQCQRPGILLVWTPRFLVALCMGEGHPYAHSLEWDTPLIHWPNTL